MAVAAVGQSDGEARAGAGNVRERLGAELERHAGLDRQEKQLGGGGADVRQTCPSTAIGANGRPEFRGFAVVLIFVGPENAPEAAAI